MREDYQFYHVYGDNVSKFGGKIGELRLYQKPHLQSKFEKPVSAHNHAPLGPGLCDPHQSAIFRICL